MRVLNCERCLSHATHVPSNSLSLAVRINRVNTLRLRGHIGNRRRLSQHVAAAPGPHHRPLKTGTRLETRAMANDVLSNRYNRYMSRESATTASVLTAYSDVVIPVGQSHPA